MTHADISDAVTTALEWIEQTNERPDGFSPPPPDDFSYADALCEFQSMLDAAVFVRIIFDEWASDSDIARPPVVQALALTALRYTGCETIKRAAQLLGYRKVPRIASDVRWLAAVTLGLIGPLAIAAVPKLLRRLRRERNGNTRAAIAWALGEIAPRRPDVRRSLVLALACDLCDRVHAHAEIALNSDLCVADLAWRISDDARPRAVPSMN